VKRGDVITVNGVKGIVYQTDGEHGKAMSVKAFRGVEEAWCKSGRLAGRVKTVSRESGRENTEAIFRFVEENGLDVSDFPVFAWCKSLGEGWYIPAIQELEDFISWWFGGDEELDWGSDDDDDDDEGNKGILVVDDGKPHPKVVNKAMLDAGGIPFFNGVYSSTENKQGKILIFSYAEWRKAWKIAAISKSSVGKKQVGRAFYEF
jgi:hypothetical protein